MYIFKSYPNHELVNRSTRKGAGGDDPGALTCSLRQVGSIQEGAYRRHAGIGIEAHAVIEHILRVLGFRV